MNIYDYKAAYLNNVCQIIRFNVEGQILESCNTLFSCQQLLATNIYDTFPLLDSMRDTIEAMAAGESPMVFRCVEMEIDQREWLLDISISVQPDTPNERVYLLLMTDNTEHYMQLRVLQQQRNQSVISQEYAELQNRAMRAEKELLHLKNTELERTYKYKTDFYAHISHEIRTPIHGITGITQLLKNRITDDAEAALYLDTILASSRHLVGIVNELLDYAKIEAGKMVFEEINFDLQQTCKAALLLFSYQNKEGKTDFKLDFEPSLPKYLIGDERRLSQVLYNLIGNAVKFTPEGSISLIVKQLRETDDDCTIRFQICDTGIGMNAEQLSRIFVPYTQLGKDTFQRYGGTGLGLSIVQQMIELQNGTITVTSEPQKGTCFNVELTFLKPQKSYKEINTEQLAEVKVLLVDDDLVNRTIAHTLLLQKGLNVKLAEDGVQAVEMASEEPFNLILMDLHMPQMDGIEAVKIIRQDGASRDARIIALTATDDPDELVACMNAGMNDHLPKPFEQESLYRKVIGALV